MDDQLTNIGEVFYYQILVQKLLGIYMFDVPCRYVALAYRYLMPSVMGEISFYLDEMTLYQDGFKDEPETPTSERISRNFNFYENIYGAMKRVATIHTLFNDFRVHNTSQLIYEKKFQKKFLYELKPERDQNRRRSTPNIDFLNRSTATIVLVLALSSTLFEFILYVQVGSAKLEVDSPASSKLIASEEFGPVEIDASENENETKQFSAINYAARLILFFLGELLSHFYYLSFSQATPILYVAACLSDILMRINEHNEPASKQEIGPRATIDPTNNGTRRRRRAVPLSQTAELTVPMKRASRQESSPVQTIKMLEHTRDVLISLRQSFSLSYATLYVYSMTEMLVNIGYLVAIGRGEYTRQDLIFFMSFLGQFFKIVQERLVYSRLLDEVDAIREAYQKRLLHPSGRLTVEEQAIVSLAEEIGEIWPSNWINCDLQSYLSNVMSMFVFAINLHQAASKRL